VPLGRIDFQNIPTFEPVAAGTYDGFTETWEAKPTKAGDSTNVEGKFKFNYQDGDGNEAQRSIIARWNLKKEALWRLRQDLVNMGVDPSELNSDAVDLESVLNQVFGAVPTPVTLSIIQRTWTPPDGGETQVRNEIASVKLRES
jgi:hypothetical protein